LFCDSLKPTIVANCVLRLSKDVWHLFFAAIFQPPKGEEYLPFGGSFFSYLGFQPQLGENIMSYINEVVLLGHLGKDPEILRSTSKGDFTRLTLATTKEYLLNGASKKDTQWHTVYLSNGLGKAAVNHLNKGSRAYVSGELRTNSWTDKKTGEKQYATAVYASRVIFLDMKSTDPDNTVGCSVQSEAEASESSNIQDQSA